MFYVFALFIPLLILVVLYYVRKPYLNRIPQYLDFSFKALPFLAAYAFVLYYLETEDLVNSGYAFLALITFLIPVTIVCII